jgi:Homing endonuclease associated repeat/HNH endonuclease
VTFQLEPFNRNVPDEALLAKLKRVASELGKPTVTIDEFNENGKFHSTTLSRRFGTWFKALEAAGLGKTRNLNISNEELFANLVELWVRGGRQPRYNDLTPGRSRYSSGTYANRFGSWRAALEAFVDWANDKGTVDEAPPTRADLPSRRTPRTINWRLRALVLMRDGARCQMCGATVQSGATLHVDHKTPWSKGGETVIENLQILCEQCNIGKSDVEPEA